MFQNEVILCGSSSYTRKFYLNRDFSRLPEAIKEELQIMCVLFTEDVGGTLQLVFDAEGKLEFRTEVEEGDLLYDEIGSVLKIKQLRSEKQELLSALQMYYRVFFMGEGLKEE